MRCTICQKPIQPKPENSFAPFCSSRCRMADLDRWLKGSYAIAGEPVAINPDTQEPAPEENSRD